MTTTPTSGYAAPGKARRMLRVLTSYAGLAALGGTLAVAAAPAASADEVLPLTGGSAAWGVKESFRGYVGSPIAHGGYEASGGATVLADGTVDFPTAGGSVSKEDASGDVSFEGTVVFTGHDYGQGPVLEVRVSDPRVEFEGDTATVYADVTSREFAGANPSLPPGDLIEYGQVAVTELTGAELTVEEEEIVFTSQAGALHADAVDPFAGFYAAGATMDPLSFTAGIGDVTEPGGPGEPVHDPGVTVVPSENLDPAGDTVTVEGTGFRPGQGVYAALTAAPQSADSYPGHHTGAVWLRGADAPGEDGSFSTDVQVTGSYSKDGTAYDCAETQCYVAVFNDHTDIANRDQDVWTPVSFATEDGPTDEPTDPGGEPTDPDAPEEPLTVHNGRADWGVKESFRDYITGSIAHGAITPRDGATRNEDGTFAFTGGSGEVDLSESVADISFEGTVAFEGHAHDGADPLLMMTVSDPRVEIDGDAGVLHADVTSKSLSGGESVTYEDVAFAELDLADVGYTLEDDVLSWDPIPASLAAEGVPAFADFYSTGEALDPLTLTVSVGEDAQVPGGGGDGSGDGDPAPGPGDGDGDGGLPNTGTALTGLLAAAAVAVGAGGVAVYASRRRRDGSSLEPEAP
ncbi:HtaA domain-containing protein [Nocardiopsis quinghaiensis]|uniref:HtaA domain-containing protein n=1 Tax=Nocardiopsis quinghaiensis TaxID=464995 RepID=UPI00123B19C6|nr:HtaA domain-containing protein [Nocardiopsis quinghaiensis]